MFGVPRRVITDRGTAYTSRQFEMYCAGQGIRHSLISVRHPQTNGQMERVNGTLVPLQVTAETEVTWDKKIAEMECQLNNAINKTIGDTPFHVLYGYYPSVTDLKSCGNRTKI
jgi:transposase InsO family protein